MCRHDAERFLSLLVNPQIRKRDLSISMINEFISPHNTICGQAESQVVLWLTGMSEDHNQGNLCESHVTSWHEFVNEGPGGKSGCIWLDST